MLETCNLIPSPDRHFLLTRTEELLPDQRIKQPAKTSSSEYAFSSPSDPWWDIRNSKSFTIFKNNPQKWENFYWVQEELKSRGLQPTEKEQDGELVMEEEEEEEEEEMNNIQGTRHKQQEDVKQEALFLSDPEPYVLEDYTSQVASLVVALLKACAEQEDLHRGFAIHAHIVGTGVLEKNVFVGSSLINMYAKCGALAKAQEVFDMLHVRNIVSWNALIAGYTQQGYGEVALNLFKRMQLEGFPPNEVTFSCVLKACGSIGALDKGQDIHTQIIEDCLLETNIVVMNALLDMYSKCGALEKAREVFDELPIRSTVSWTVLIAGYTHHDLGQEALTCFDQMQAGGFSPDGFTYACILKACGNVGALKRGREMHFQIVKGGLLDIHVGTALVDMYAKCGALQKAQEVFDKLPSRNLMSWNALIAGYAQHRYGEEALICFEWMQFDGFSPDIVTFACVLEACSGIGATYRGQEIHVHIVRHGFLEKGVVVDTALVHMYANCGMLAEAQSLFDKLSTRDVVSWSVLMVGYAQLGKDRLVFDLFDRMIAEGTNPDSITFTIVLNTCSQNGLLEEGQGYFEFINKGYGIIPTSEHHTCMVDLFGRAGRLDKAVAVVEEMPLSVDLTMWHTFLGACRKWGNMESGRWAFKNAVRMNKMDAAAYICMSNMYAAADRQNNFLKLESMTVRNPAWKKPGDSLWIDTSGIIHLFSVGDKSHPQSKDIHAKFQSMARDLSRDCLSLDSLHPLDGEKQDVLCGHTEKSAIVCALINTSDETHIYIVKNLHICGFCHSAISLISKVEKRRIYVRDVNRLHIFEGGYCAC